MSWSWPTLQRRSCPRDGPQGDFGGERWLTVLEFIGGGASRDLQDRGPRCVEYFFSQRPTSTCASPLVTTPVYRLITQLGCYGTIFDLAKLEACVSLFR